MLRRNGQIFLSLWLGLSLLPSLAFAKRAVEDAPANKLFVPPSILVTHGLVTSGNAKAAVQHLPVLSAAHLAYQGVATKTSPLGTHYFFRETYRALPIYGSEASVHLSPEGKVWALGHAISDDNIELDISPKVAMETALAAFEVAGLRETKSELVVAYASAGWTLAWHIQKAVEAGATWEYFVDAHTGSMLSHPRDINKYQGNKPVMGRVFKANALVALKSNDLKDDNGSTKAVPEGAYSKVELLDLEKGPYLNGKYATSKGNSKQTKSVDGDFLFSRSSVGFDETMGYYYIDYAQRFIQSLGFTSINNRAVKYSVDRYSGDNSFYSPLGKDITFGSGGVNDGEDAEVILHELGHAIHDNQVPGWGASTEAGAMGEGFGDFFAAATLSVLSDGFQDDCVAEWDAVSYDANIPPCLRRLDSKKIYPKDLDGEVHDDGEIWSAALWEVYNTVGRETAVKVVLESHYLLSTRASMNDGAQAVFATAKALKVSDKELAAIEAILKARGFSIASK